MRLIHGMVGAAAVLVVIAILGGVALVALTTRALDRIEAQDEINLTHRSLARDLTRMRHELASATVWDDAYKALGPRFDAAWADADLAAYYKAQFHHDLTFVMRSGQVIYAARDGQRVAPTRLGDFPAQAAPLAQAIAQDARRALDAGRLGAAAEVSRAGLMRVDGDTYLVALGSVAPDSRAVAERHGGPPTVVVTARRLDAAFIRDFSVAYGLDQLELRAAPVGLKPYAPLRDIGGRSIGVLTWDSADPGLSLLKALAPWLAGGFLAMSLAAILLFRRVAEALTQLKRGRRELVAAKEEAEAANAAKTLFLANMSHEIRTPLNGVLGMAQVMAADTLSEPQARRLKILEESGRSLLAFLNDILEIARLESRAVRLRDEAFDLADLVETACAAFSGAAAAKRLGLVTDIAAEARGRWRGDPMRLRQVLSNLVANAIKFTEVGCVTVRVRPSAKGLRFEVEDTGPGLAPEHLASLFKRFSQVDSSATRQHDGAGLGLSICRELVELMGGAIDVQTAPGHGASFHFVIPLERLADERPTLRVVS